MASPRAAVGVDLGGTKIAGIVMRDDGEVLETLEAPTPRTADDIVSALVDAIEDLRARGDVGAVGVGVAGMVDVEAGVLRFAPNLPLRELPLRAMLGKRLALPVVVDNDANVAGWGELRFGAARGARDVLAVTVGTGIGGAIITDGRLYRGAHGFAAEIGHVIVEPGGPLCGCGNRGCWEQVASGNAVTRLAREAAAREPDGAIAGAAGGAPATGLHVSAAARGGDPTALAIFAEVGRRLGEGLAGLANVLDPELIVVGGGVAEEGELLLDPARAAFWDTVEFRRDRPDVPIVVAELGNEAGAMGAAALALEEAR